MKNFIELENIAKQIRRKTLEIIFNAGSGHPGGSLSSVDIGTSLFFYLMNHDPNNPNWKDRDRFILSKGHAAPLLYVILQMSGYFPENWLSTFRKINSPLQGHPNSLKCPGIEVSTGSLGQGLSIACGMALSLKKDNMKSIVYTLHGDGELNEGQIWEAVMFAAHYKLNNLIAFIDKNDLQIDGSTDEVMSMKSIEEKFSAFNWNVLTCDGHSITDIVNKTIEAKKSIKPSVIIAKTIKGKGVSFMENVAGWHGKSPSKIELQLALEELE